MHTCYITSKTDSLFFFNRFGASCKEILAAEEEIFQGYCATISTKLDSRSGIRVARAAKCDDTNAK